MSLLQIFFIVSGYVIFLVAIDVAKKQRVHALHFLIFAGIGFGLLLFTLVPNTLETLGHIFGVQRGADVLVYGSIIFLLYFVLRLLDNIEKTKEDLTKLIREIALQSAKWELNPHDSVAFIIPAYNEASVLEKTVSTVFENGYHNCVLINDGSRDNTLAVVKKMQEKYGSLVILHHYKNRGQWAGLETGFEYIRRHGEHIEYVVTYDADGQHDIKDLPKFLDAFKKDTSLEVALGSRFLESQPSNIPTARKILLKCAILFTYIVSQIRLSDTHNGYRVFRKKTLDLVSITLDGMGHASEIIDIISQKKLSFVEIPVHIHYDEYSLKKGQKSSNAINIALRVLWKKFF